MLPLKALETFGESVNLLLERLDPDVCMAGETKRGRRRFLPFVHLATHAFEVCALFLKHLRVLGQRLLDVAEDHRRRIGRFPRHRRYSAAISAGSECGFAASSSMR